MRRPGALGNGMVMNWVRQSKSGARVVGSLLAVLLVALGAVRFVGAGLLPAISALRGDFQAAFPTAYFARLRPDFPTDSVWAGWNYGPMVHFLTLPLLLVPRWSMVPPLWALTNGAALVLSFVLVCRLSGTMRQVSWAAVAALAGLWLLYQPLANCFAQGNIEIIEMAMILGAVAALPRSKGGWSGVLLGVATMTKYLPVGFLLWFLLRRQWRAVGAGIATIMVILAVTTVTLGWKDSISLNSMSWAVTTPFGGLHELSVTSLFLHRAGLLDYHVPSLRWFPTARAFTAQDAGLLASVLLAAAYGLVLFFRRHRPVSALEVSVLFMTMFMILPWNHDYYYLFGLVPLSVLFLRGVALRDWKLLAVTIAAYVMISPPIPFGLIDNTHWFALSFAYTINYLNVPVVGGLILWVTATHQMFAESREDEATVRGWRGLANRRVAMAALAMVVVTAVYLGITRTRSAKDAREGSISDLHVLPPMLLSGPAALAVSPDGTRIAYVARVGSARGLCLRMLDGRATTCLPETEDAAGPFFSPDGRWIGFFASGQLKKAPVAGGAPEVITAAAGGRTASWGRDGTIVFATPYGIVRVAAAGGASTVVIPAGSSNEGNYLSPTLAPSGDMIFFTIGRPGDDLGAGTIAAQSLRTGQRARLLTGSQPHFDETSGHLLYALGARVLAVPFDPGTLALSGVSVPIAANAQVTLDGGAQFAVSENDVLVYAPGGPATTIRRSLVWVDRQGSAMPLPILPNAFETPSLSPDGRTLAVAIRDVPTDLWTYDLTTGTAARLTFAASRNDTPIWMPDGRTVLFAVPGVPRSAVVSTRVDGGDREPTQLWEGSTPVQLSSRSRDGHLLAGTQAGDLWILDTTKKDLPGLNDKRGESRLPAASRRRVFLIQTPFQEQTPVFSPDGRWIAYTSDESGRNEVYVQSFPSFNEWRVSSNGGEEPLWAPDGRELFYRRGNTMMAVSVETRNTFVAGRPRRLFRGSYLNTPGARHYDVAPDGRHFLMIGTEPASFRNDVRVVSGWRSRLSH